MRVCFGTAVCLSLIITVLHTSTSRVRVLFTTRSLLRILKRTDNKYEAEIFVSPPYFAIDNYFFVGYNEIKMHFVVGGDVLDAPPIT